MKRKIGMFAGLVGASLLASQAMAVYVPGVGSTEIKLTDGTSFYRDGTVVPRGNTPETGDQDFTAFRLTTANNANQNAGLDFNPDTAGHITGEVSFLQYSSGFTPFVLGHPEDGGTATLENSTRSHQTAALPASVATALGVPTNSATLGRFFVYENDPGTASTANFGVSGGEATDVDFGQTQDGFTIDTLPNFTAGTLLATGSLIDTFGDPTDGQITQFFVPTGLASSSGVQLESTLSGTLVLDGGVWFADGIQDATFSIHLYTILASQTTYPTAPTPIRQDVFNGGWAASSEDPITIKVVPAAGVPEPITAGLGTLALASLAGYSTRRRRMA